MEINIHLLPESEYSVSEFETYDQQFDNESLTILAGGITEYDYKLILRHRKVYADSAMIHVIDVKAVGMVISPTLINWEALDELAITTLTKFLMMMEREISDRKLRPTNALSYPHDVVLLHTSRARNLLVAMIESK